MYKEDEDEQRHPKTKIDVDMMLQKNGIRLKNNVGYDAVYVANMCCNDFIGSSVKEEDLGKFIKNYLDDPDGYPEVAMTRFYADCIGKGIPIIWEDML